MRSLLWKMQLIDVAIWMDFLQIMNSAVDPFTDWGLWTCPKATFEFLFLEVLRLQACW